MSDAMIAISGSFIPCVVVAGVRRAYGRGVKVGHAGPSVADGDQFQGASHARTQVVGLFDQEPGHLQANRPAPQQCHAHRGVTGAHHV